MKMLLENKMIQNKQHPFFNMTKPVFEATETKRDRLETKRNINGDLAYELGALKKALFSQKNHS